MTNPKWKEYTGSDEQIAEILQAELFIVDSKASCFQKPSTLKMPVTETYMTWLTEIFETGNVKNYLICQPHPEEAKIRQWALTGQPVWVRIVTAGYGAVVSVTTTPDWNIPGAEYRFTPFEGEV